MFGICGDGVDPMEHKDPQHVASVCHLLELAWPSAHDAACVGSAMYHSASSRSQWARGRALRLPALHGHIC